MRGIATIAGKYFEIFAQSAALLTSCLAYQTTLDAKYAALEDNYYHRSIAVFTRELQISTSVDNEATVYAALLLCSISVCDQASVHGISCSLTIRPDEPRSAMDNSS